MIYLDYAATTPVDRSVASSFSDTQRAFFANPESLHFAGVQARELLQDAKKQMAQLLRVQSDELIITSGATEANNLALFGIARAYKKRGNHIITTNIEHASVAKPLEALEKEGFEVTYLPVNQDGQVQSADVLSALKPTTILVSLIHINNEIGSIQPLREIAQDLKKQAPKVIIHSDMAQTIGKMPVDLTNIDVATFSGHKFYAPKAVGLLYKKKSITLEPLFYGGLQQAGLRPGTQDAALVAAMAKAMRLSFERLADKTAQEDIRIKERYLIDNLASQKGVRLTLSHDDVTKVTPSIIHFQIVDSRTQIETYLNAFSRAGICLATRSTCHNKAIHEPNRILQALGYTDRESRRGIRISFSHLTDMDELAFFVRKLHEILQDLAL